MTFYGISLTLPAVNGISSVSIAAIIRERVMSLSSGRHNSGVPPGVVDGSTCQWSGGCSTAILLFGGRRLPSSRMKYRQYGGRSRMTALWRHGDDRHSFNKLLTYCRRLLKAGLLGVSDIDGVLACGPYDGYATAYAAVRAAERVLKTASPLLFRRGVPCSSSRSSPAINSLLPWRLSSVPSRFRFIQQRVHAWAW